MLAEGLANTNGSLIKMLTETKDNAAKEASDAALKASLAEINIEILQAYYLQNIAGIFQRYILSYSRSMSFF